jgi:hypothetical protein
MSEQPAKFVEIATATSAARLNELVDRWLTSQKITKDMLGPDDLKIEHVRVADGSGSLRALVRRDLAFNWDDST